MAKNNQNIFKYGTVVSVDDAYEGGRIKVYIRGTDPQKYIIDELPYAFPLLPKTLHIKPQIGEMVFVFTQSGDYNDDRFWVGPIISQHDKMKYDSITALSFLNAGLTKVNKPLSTNPENEGVNMDNSDIGLYGRGNADVIVKPNEIRLRAGKSYDLKSFNKDNISFVQIKNQKDKNSSVNIVADEINLISHKSKDKYDVLNPTDLITDEEYKRIIETAHALPYGDTLVEFLNLFIKAFSTHVHAYNGLPPDLKQKELIELSNFDLNTMLSKNIKIN